MNVVFDLGNVLIDWNPRYLFRSVFADPAQMEWFLEHVCSHDWNLENDRGRSLDDAVLEATARHPEYKAEIEIWRDRWMEMIPGAIAGSVQILQDLHDRNVPLYAITNWNGDTFRATRHRFSFLGLFRDIVVSGDEKLIKPDPAIFNLFAQRNSVDLSHSLFIDDNLGNVRGAEAVGMRGHHFKSPESLRSDLVAMGIL